MSESVCRCPCSDESAEVLEEDRCCPPYLFTSILLGALACVLMTGGVFLAFHRWDPMWLIVSGIGIVLVLIGSVLHCCGKSTTLNTRAERKSCCGRHAHHMVAGAGSLNEQLLPLTNARSVSQLSLNMLPGYFPPVVTTYGLEQHSAMVQNINQIIQQHNGPASNTNCPASGNGKLVLLQLPVDTNATNVQGMVAAVYQLDGGHTATEMSADNAVPVQLLSNPVTAIPVLKHAEVQTCNVWPIVPPHLQVNQIQSTSSTAIDSLNCSNGRSEVVVATSTGATQTEDLTEHLVDNSNCDIPRTNDETENSNSASSNPLNEIASTDIDTVPSNQSSTNNGDFSSDRHEGDGNPPSGSETTTNPELPSVIEPTVASSNAIPHVVISDTATTSTESTTNDLSGHSTDTLISPSDDVVINIPVEQNVAAESAIADGQCNMDNAESNSLEIDLDDALSNCSNLSERDELPPSYEDVALGNDTAVAGSYGIGYGTI